MKFFLTTLLTTLYFFGNAQEFKSKIWIEDASGRIDSVQIGYDPSASESIDGMFGASGITNQPWSEFEIRASQIDVSEIIIGEDLTNPRPISELSRYQTKTEIIPKNCVGHIGVSNQSGYLPFITLFISTDSYPIKVKWNQEEFENDCLSRSVISDWPISTWWDIPCCTNLEINETQFSTVSEITVNNHLGVEVVNENFDTLIMLNMSLRDGLGVSTSDLEANSFEIFPNPVSNYITIASNTGIDRVDFVSNEGELLSSQVSNEDGKYDLSLIPKGLYYVSIQSENGQITLKPILISL